MSKQIKRAAQRPQSAGAARALAALPFLGGLAYFFAVCLCGPSTIKVTALVLALPTIAAFVWLLRWRDRLSPTLIALALVCLMGGLSTLYAVSGKFALYEFLKLLCALFLTLVLLAFCRGSDPGRAIAQVLSTFSALAGLVSIDLLSTRLVSGALLGVLGWFSPDYTGLAGVEPGVRMVSLFENPNFFAGVVGLGTLLSLSLVLAEPQGGRRAAHVCLLYVNALAFLLAFSMGASASIALAFLVFLLLELPQRRAGALVLMVETLLLAVLAAALISKTAFQAWDGFQPIPLLCAIAGSAGLWALDRFVGSRLAEKLQGKVVLAVLIGLAAALGIFALVATHWTSGITLGQGETLRRALYLQPGAYTLQADPAEAPVTVLVESQNQRDTIMHTSSTLYEGPLSSASFTVPEDSLVVYFNFTAQGEVRLAAVDCQGDSGGQSVPLGYPLLPGFVANRLQGLRANQNAIQRLVFFSDGLKIFRRSPVIGLGMGAYENAIRGVQSFDYQTKYAHNHYIQTLVETGVVGLVLFVGLLAVSAACVLFARRKRGEDGQAVCHPLTPALGAAVVFMAVHAAIEVVFSTYPYLPMAFGVFALIGLCCGDALPLPKPGKRVQAAVFGVMAALVAVFLVALLCNVMADSTVDRKQAAHSLSLSDLRDAAENDPFEWADYALSYVNSVTTMHADGTQLSDTNLSLAARYAQKLEREDSNTIPRYLAQYYFEMGQPEQGFAMIEKYVTYVSASPETWNLALSILSNYDTDHDPAYHQSAQRVVQMLADWNQANMGTIVPDAALQPFLDHIAQ